MWMTGSSSSRMLSWFWLGTLLLLVGDCNAFAPIFPSTTQTGVIRSSSSSRNSCCHGMTATSSSSSSLSLSVWETLQDATVINPSTGKSCLALDGLSLNNNNNNDNNWWSNLFVSSSNDGNSSKKCLVVVMPQLGDFDSVEYAEMLMAVKDDLIAANVELRLIGIGSVDSSRKFADFVGLPLDIIRVDPTGQLHQQLNLHGGPNWDIPSWIPSSVLQWFANYVNAQLPDTISDDDKLDQQRDITRAWLNYMAMCAGIAAPDTLPEIFRGYVGDKSAPERLSQDAVVTVGGNGDDNDDDDAFIVIQGTTDVKLGPIQYQSLWKNEKGYQRPAELATVRLRAMVEILTNLQTYIPDQRYVHLRGATYLFDIPTGDLLYNHRDSGVLSYSPTMPRPLSFLQPYIGNKAFNPLQLGDTTTTTTTTTDFQ